MYSVCFSNESVKGINIMRKNINISYKNILQRCVHTYTHTCCRVSIVLKIYLFNHCQKHNLDADRCVSSHLSLSNGQNRVEESSRTKKALLYVFRFPFFTPSLRRPSPFLSSFLSFSLSQTISTDWFRRLAWFPPCRCDTTS